jgi:hypothetical protein
MKFVTKVCRRCGLKYECPEYEAGNICYECIKDQEVYDKYIGV